MKGNNCICKHPETKGDYRTDTGQLKLQWQVWTCAKTRNQRQNSLEMQRALQQKDKTFTGTSEVIHWQNKGWGGNKSEKNQHITAVLQKTRKARNWEIPSLGAAIWHKPETLQAQFGFLPSNAASLQDSPHANETISTGKPHLIHLNLDQAYYICRRASHEVLSTN